MDMAKKCNHVIGHLLQDLYLDRWTVNQLNNARNHLECVAAFLSKLEKRYPENRISSQLKPLFMEACDNFFEIPSGQGRMISKVLQVIKLEFIAERLKASSEASRSTSLMILEVLQRIKPENIAEKIKASKPSRSSSIITMEMVEFVETLLDCATSCLYHVLRLVHHPPTSVLKRKLRCLRVFFPLIAKRCIQPESMNDFFAHVEDVAYSAAQLCFLGLTCNVDWEFSDLLERTSPFRPDFRQIYMSFLIGLKSLRSESTKDAGDMLDFVSTLQEDLEELLRCGDRTSWLQQGLSYLSRFLWDIKSNRIPQGEFIPLQSHMETLAIEVAIGIFCSYDEGMDNNTELNNVLFLLQLKISHFKLEIDLIELLNSGGTIVAPLQDLIDYVRQELIFLKTPLVDALEHCKEQTKITDFLTLIQSVTSQASSFINSFPCSTKQEELTIEINRVHFQFLLKFKFIKAVISQMCLNISAPSTMDHPTENLLNFLPINFEAIDSYFNKLKSSNTSSSGSHKVNEVLRGFHEYILDNLQVKDENSLTITAANEVKKFYYGFLLLVTYLIEAESGMCLSYEDAVDSNKVIQWVVLQFLTVALRLMESEGSLMNLLNLKTTLNAQVLDLIGSAHEEIIFLRAILMDLLRQRTDLNKLHVILMHAEVTANKIAQISGSCYGSFLDGSSSEKMRLLLADMLHEIEFVKVELRKVCSQVLDTSPCNLPEVEGLINFLLNHQDWLLNYDACSITFLKNQIGAVKDKLVYLPSFLADIVQYRDIHKELKELSKRVQDIKYVCFFPIKGYKPTWYYLLYLSDVRQLVKFVEAEVEMICRKVPDSSSYSIPKTNGLGFLHCFLGKLDELLHSKIDSVIGLKHQIGSIKEGLLRLTSLSDHFAESYDEHDEAYSLITSVSEIAYKAEYVINSCLAYSHPLWYKILWISEVVENIKLVNKVFSETSERKINVAVQKVKKTSTELAPSLSNNTPRADETEGFQDAMDKAKKQLLGGSPELDVISLVGMPGIGKTTLAEKIYIDLIAIRHFDVHAKCRVTQIYSWRELLLTILNGVCEPVHRTEKGDGELADELRRFLLTKRFLILIDDVWDTKVWDRLHMCFKDAQNGSRIILTTRLCDVASYAQCESKPHHLRLFRDDESWTLLHKEVFQGEICPPKLVDVGFRIAKNCGGLPLFILLVAGVLTVKKKKLELWKDIEESLFSQNIGWSEESMSVIGFSYKNLPHQLKPCFLYFGGLSKGKDIHVSKLTRLWVAEGFVQANMEKKPEDVGQGFLEDLISRNLVMVVEKRPNGEVKTCRIHDLLHKYCTEKAKQENFLLRINRFCGEDTFPEKPKDYRLFVHSYQDQIDHWQPSCSSLSSLLVNVIDPDNLLWPRDISFIFNSFKLIKVLDLESFNIGGTFPCEIQSLIHMRYFAAQIDANSIPSSLANLWNLETFVVRGLGGEVILPFSMLKMVKLRHIIVKHRASFSPHLNMDESLANSQLDNLETFSTPRLSYGKDAETILAKMPNLRKLSCVFSGTFGYSEEVKGRCVLFPRLEFLGHLESLRLVSKSYPANLPHVFSFPSNLRVLTLSKFHLPWSQISSIGELPNLEILKLLLRAFEGDQWEVKDSEFPELKYLELDDINIAQWSVSDDAFPKLERLVLTKCKRLVKIPSHFEEAVSLSSIEVNWCSWSVANSAHDIQTMQHEGMANAAFTITIHPPDLARRSSP